MFIVSLMRVSRLTWVAPAYLIGRRAFDRCQRRRRGVFVEVQYWGKSRLVVVPAGRNGRFRMRQYELIDLTKD